MTFERFQLVCPRCGKQSETVIDKQRPHVNCGDCLMKRCEVVEMNITSSEPDK